MEDKVYLTYNDVTIKPSVISGIEHRNECKPYDEDGKLPVFTAPMSTVVDYENFYKFDENGIIPILPRNIEIGKRMNFALNGKWAAFSLKEFEKYFCDEISDFNAANNIKVLIDVANGHMQKLYDLVKKSKSIFNKRIKIMVGNIANPDTYTIAAQSGVDYIRVGIGGGQGCITTSNTGIHTPMASLINDVARLKKDLIAMGYDGEKLPKIIADGGIRNYSDIIKAIALGADYVMVGSVLAKALESAGELKVCIKNALNHDDLVMINVKRNELYYNKAEKKWYYKGTKAEKLLKHFYGMASSEGQKDLFGDKIKTSEGIAKDLEVEYTLKQWTENLDDYFKSAMSYTNSRTLDELKNAEVIRISENSYNTVNR